MSKEEVENLSDEDLKNHWDIIKVSYNSSLSQHLSNIQSMILFADFVNVSLELKKRDTTNDK